jgi:hypothetical protein
LEAATHSLSDCLAHFCNSVNLNPIIPPLIKGWEPNIIISCEDSDEAFTLYVRNCKAESIRPGQDQSHTHVVEISARQEVLCGIFSGRQNAASKFLEGELAIFGSDKDQVKLDAIALLVWDV